MLSGVTAPVPLANSTHERRSPSRSHELIKRHRETRSQLRQGWDGKRGKMQAHKTYPMAASPFHESIVNYSQLLRSVRLSIGAEMTDTTTRGRPKPHEAADLRSPPVRAELPGSLRSAMPGAAVPRFPSFPPSSSRLRGRLPCAVSRFLCGP